MGSWNEGYVSEIQYTFGYYRELSPDFLDFALLLRGIEPPSHNQERAYCELGFGQGMSIAMHSAANPGINVIGTDFNPAHTSFARSLAHASGTSPRLYEDSFADLANRADLPEFDYIGLHGIWTWISRDNHKIVTDFIHRKLKPGGVLYISYNALPGWGPLMPLRHILNQHAEFAGSGTQGIIGRINSALDFTKELFDKNPLYCSMVPIAKTRLEKLMGQDRSYMAHEYLTQDWIPMYFTDMAKIMSEAKLDFCTSTQLLESLENVSFPPEIAKFLNSIPHPLLREQTKDYFSNQQFRRDIFVRGPRKIDPLTQRDRLLETRVVLTSLIEEIQLKAQVAMGEITLQEETYKPLLEALAADNYRPKSIRELSARIPNLGSLIQAIIILVSCNHLAPVRNDKVTSESSRYCTALNRHLLSLTRAGAGTNFLVSPLTGTGIPVSRIHQFFITALVSGEKKPEGWAAYAWKSMQELGQRLLKEGKTIESPDDNLTEIQSLATAFVPKAAQYKTLKLV